MSFHQHLARCKHRGVEVFLRDCDVKLIAGSYEDDSVAGNVPVPSTRGGLYILLHRFECFAATNFGVLLIAPVVQLATSKAPDG